MVWSDYSVILVLAMILLRCTGCENDVEVTEPVSPLTLTCCKCGQLLKSSDIVPEPDGIDPARLVDTKLLPPKKSSLAAEGKVLPPSKTPKNQADPESTVDLRQLKKLIEEAKETSPDTELFRGPKDDVRHAGSDLKKQTPTDWEQIIASLLEPALTPDELGWLGPYRVLKLLGKGGMGLVFHAQDSRLKRPVALKVMHPQLAQDLTVRQRFLREARATANIRNDHIVTIHEVGQYHDIPYLAAEFLRGQSLEDWLLQGIRPDPKQILDIALQGARGLAAAHKAGVIHRDIKPGNLWLETTDEGERIKDKKPNSLAEFLLSPPPFRVKILDFGLAHTDEGDLVLTKFGTVLGTPAYMAPEQSDGRPVDARCDLFSLGCVLYELAAGFRPFDGESPLAMAKVIALAEPRPLPEVNRDMSRSFCDLVMKLLAKNPDDRPASAEEVVRSLETLIAEHAESELASAAGVDTSADGREGKRPWVTAAVAGLAAVLGIGVAVWLLVSLFRISTP